MRPVRWRQKLHRAVWIRGRHRLPVDRAALPRRAAQVQHGRARRAGGTSIVLEKFDPEGALRCIAEHGVTHSQWVPTMFIRMLRLPEATRNRYTLTTHRLAIHAAAPCPVDVKEQMLAWWGPIVHEYYGGSESIGMCAITPEEWLWHKGSVGRAVRGELHILDEQGTELPPHHTGTVYFANGGQFLYHNDPAKTARAHNDKGWATFGDIGHVDEEGYLYLTDRRDYVINSGGVNIHPQEAENLLCLHEKVADVAVFGVPNEEFGEEVKAVVVPRSMDDAGPSLATGADRALQTPPCPASSARERSTSHPTCRGADGQALQAADTRSILDRAAGPLTDYKRAIR